MRGPQTIGEIRSRTDRMYAFQSIDEVQETISNLENTGGLLSKLPRQPGRKESRYSHLLSGDPQETIVETIPRPEAATVIVRKEHKRIEELEKQIDTLRRELQTLQLEFVNFKSQFD